MKDKPSWIIGGACILVAVVAGIIVRLTSAAADDSRPAPPSPTTSTHALGAAPTLVPAQATLAIATVSRR